MDVLASFLWIIPTAFFIVFFSLKCSRPNDLIEVK